MDSIISVCSCVDICPSYITRKGGRRDFASSHGFKCWPIKDTRSCAVHGKRAKNPSLFDELNA